jgi:hypothetical protein
LAELGLSFMGEHATASRQSTNSAKFGNRGRTTPMGYVTLPRIPTT